MVLSQRVRCDVVGCGVKGLLNRQWEASQYLGSRNRLATIHLCPTCRDAFKSLDTTEAMKFLAPFDGVRPEWVR